MDTFEYNGYVWKITDNTHPYFVYAKKLVDGKSGRGRPSKFLRADVGVSITEATETAVVLDTNNSVTESSENGHSEIGEPEEEFQLF